MTEKTFTQEEYDKFYPFRECEGCREEMEDCYEYQQQGYDAGLEYKNGHCFLFVFDKKGKMIID